MDYTTPKEVAARWGIRTLSRGSLRQWANQGCRVHW